MLGFFKKEVPPPIVSNIENILRDGSDLLSNDKIILTDKLSGNLFCSGEVLVSDSGVLSGNIIAGVCIIDGTINGHISSTEKLELKSTAVINGNICTPVLDIEEGAVINGVITVKQENISTKVDLFNKLNRHSAADLLSPQIKPVVADAEPTRTVAERKAEIKPASGTLRAAEKREAAVAEKPKTVQKELAAATPQPKVVEDTEVNNRWW
ncbi:polymer-forming cytoskeletal protein [Mucilaginibacter calamicampi]|uniref:Polymer-forming cytoskeletal protein n=1 Tax=Mucilaginibacter calamicampi TaxID=1302352 RepID=A0ABW2Z106_9SPHI